MMLSTESEMVHINTALGGTLRVPRDSKSAKNLIGLYLRKRGHLHSALLPISVASVAVHAP